MPPRPLAWPFWPGPGLARALPRRPISQASTMNLNLRSILAMGLFVVLAGYVGFSAIRLTLLLIERFGAS